MFNRVESLSGIPEVEFPTCIGRENPHQQLRGKYLISFMLIEIIYPILTLRI